MKIWANTIVHNEENFIWFAVMSVVDYVDKILIWDTGSTDNTVKIISEIKKEKREKIEFKQVGEVDRYQFTQMRQAMLEESRCDWILILDGDEIWWKDSIKKLISEINKKGEKSLVESSSKIEGIVVPMVVPVGDIYHIQDERAGKYHIIGRTGHISLKAFSKSIPNLHVNFPYGKEGFFDNENKVIQERKRIGFVDAPLLHVTHLRRSSHKRIFEKFKYELGSKVEEEFKFPEVFYNNFPTFVSSPWRRIKGKDLIIAKLLNPLRSINRWTISLWEMKRKLQND